LRWNQQTTGKVLDPYLGLWQSFTCEASDSGATREEITTTLGRISRIAFLVFSLILLYAFIAGSGSDPDNSPTSPLTQSRRKTQT
jgi:hypothetical protein